MWLGKRLLSKDNSILWSSDAAYGLRDDMCPLILVPILIPGLYKGRSCRGVVLTARVRGDQILSIWTKSLFHRFGNQRRVNSLKNGINDFIGAIYKIPANSSCCALFSSPAGTDLVLGPHRNIWFCWVEDWDLQFSGVVSNKFTFRSSPLGKRQEGFRDQRGRSHVSGTIVQWQSDS